MVILPINGVGNAGDFHLHQLFLKTKREAIRGDHCREVDNALWLTAIKA